MIWVAGWMMDIQKGALKQLNGVPRLCGDWDYQKNHREDPIFFCTMEEHTPLKKPFYCMAEKHMPPTSPFRI